MKIKENLIIPIIYFIFLLVIYFQTINLIKSGDGTANLGGYLLLLFTGGINTIIIATLSLFSINLEISMFIGIIIPSLIVFLLWHNR